MGGPVRIPHLFKGPYKSFFSFSWKQLKYSTSAPVTNTVPTVAERGGDFSDRLTTTVTGKNPCDGSNVYAGQIFDPATTKTVGTTECRTAFPGNVIPSGRLSSVAKALVAYYPQPTNSGVFSNYTQVSLKPITNTTYTVRVDQNVSEKIKIWGSYSTRENALFTGGFATLPSPVSTQGWWQDFTTHFGRAGFNYTMKPNLLNYLIFGADRSNSKNYSQAANIGKDWSQLVRLTNAGGKHFPGERTGDDQVG
jgi:hypothetical protein